MTTKEIVEAILYVSPNSEKFFRASHIISDERNWKAKQHSEFPFINSFTDPRFIVVIAKQIHVYIVGSQIKNRNYHIINIEGFTADLITTTKIGLIYEIKRTVSEKLFLPNNYQDRIIYMYNEDIFIFNRQETKGTIFSQSSWTVGPDVYNVDLPAYKTSAWQILKAIYSEF